MPGFRGARGARCGGARYRDARGQGCAVLRVHSGTPPRGGSGGAYGSSGTCSGPCRKACGRPRSPTPTVTLQTSPHYGASQLISGCLPCFAPDLESEDKKGSWLPK